MHNAFFKNLESITAAEKVPLQQCIDHLAFNSAGLIPVIAQCYHSGQVLMQAWMNKAAINKTLHTGRMVYWSRSRNAFWMKGETSGHIQQLKSLQFDCDGDSILCLVEQAGPACHTKRQSCFYLQANMSNNNVELHMSSDTAFSSKASS
jgi:phosphoribosyl-AMP cyclohydrolase